jgi:hypothetical protein
MSDEPPSILSFFEDDMRERYRPIASLTMRSERTSNLIVPDRCGGFWVGNFFVLATYQSGQDSALRHSSIPPHYLSKESTMPHNRRWYANRVVSGVRTPIPLFEGRSQRSCGEMPKAWLCVRQCFWRGTLMVWRKSPVEVSLILNRRHVPAR